MLFTGERLTFKTNCLYLLKTLFQHLYNVICRCSLVGSMDRGPGVDVIINDEILSKSPYCPHGPTLLFERFSATSDGKEREENRRFYACSACRDRKLCPFFRLESNHRKQNDGKTKSYNLEQKTNTTTDEMHRLNAFKKLKDSDRRFCIPCGTLLLPNEWKVHATHQILPNVTDKMLLHPSRILKPMDNAKKEAQFFFSDSTTKFIASTLIKLQFKRILCIGAPRIHEFCRSSEKECDSLLLDIDNRFLQFYDQGSFCHYNMFNHFFFDGDVSRQTYLNFMKEEDRMAIVIDPPFGGLVEVLAHTIATITKDYEHETSQTSLPVFWIFPYFLEPRLLQNVPNYVMLDYKVGYDNHPLYRSTHGHSKNRLTSPIRIFTNISPDQVKLPEDEGYRYCSSCNRWVAEENKHCNACNACTSKDGSTYVHCDSCKRCVKPSRIHCDSCGHCLPEDHECGATDKPRGCHLCGDMTHKRKACTMRNNTSRKKHKASLPSKKRKMKP